MFVPVHQDRRIRQLDDVVDAVAFQVECSVIFLDAASPDPDQLRIISDPQVVVFIFEQCRDKVVAQGIVCRKQLDLLAGRIQ
jgi:hypothetical protein